jgi:hypothetical protein
MPARQRITVLHYIAVGSVRGECGHHHRTAHTAALCVKRDQRRCARLPGGDSYSDRTVYAVSDGYAGFRCLTPIDTDYA